MSDSRNVCTNCGRRYTSGGTWGGLGKNFCCPGCRDEWNRKHSSVDSSTGENPGCISRIVGFIKTIIVWVIIAFVIVVVLEIIKH